MNAPNEEKKIAWLSKDLLFFFWISADSWFVEKIQCLWKSSSVCTEPPTLSECRCVDQ